MLKTLKDSWEILEKVQQAHGLASNYKNFVVGDQRSSVSVKLHTEPNAGTLGSLVHGKWNKSQSKQEGANLAIFKLLLLADISEVLEWEMKQEMTGLISGEKN